MMDNNSQIDLSRVISLLSENPQIISQITSALRADNSSPSEQEQAQTAGEEESLVSTDTTEETASELIDKPDAQKNRQKLLTAFKPYLSDGRAKAIDSIVTIAEVLDNFKGR